MGQTSSSQDTPLQLWRAPTPANSVEQVVDEVARLSVEDNHEQNLAAKYSSNNKQISPNDKEKNLEEDKQATQDLSDKKSKKGWKRKARENMSDQSGSPKDNVIQNTILAQGARMVRSREDNKGVAIGSSIFCPDGLDAKSRDSSLVRLRAVRELYSFLWVESQLQK